MKNGRWFLVLVSMVLAVFTSVAVAAENKIDTSELGSGAAKKESVELYLGGGSYDYDTATGTYLWGKGRVFLLNFQGVGIGPMAYYGQGNGDADQFGFDYSEWAAGVGIRPRGQTWDGTLDLGYGKHSDSGSGNFTGSWTDGDGNVWPILGASQSESKSSILYLSANLSLFQNRAAEKVWFPKWELNGTYIKYLDVTTDESWTDAIDPKSSWASSEDEGSKNNWEVEGKAWVLDIWASKNLRFTPGVVLGAGATVNDEAYTKYGLAVEVATRNMTFLQLSYEKHTGDQEGSVIGGWASVRF